MTTRVLFFSRWLWILLLMLVIQPAIGQRASEMVVDPTDPVFRATFQDVPFDGAVAVKVLEDAKKSYFLADMTAFPTRFEKIWFLNLVFDDDIIVNMDPDIARDRMWFMAFSVNTQEDILNRFEGLRERTMKANQEMTSVEKTQWMAIHDKYEKGRER